MIYTLDVTELARFSLLPSRSQLSIATVAISRKSGSYRGITVSGKWPAACAAEKSTREKERVRQRERALIFDARDLPQEVLCHGRRRRELTLALGSPRSCCNGLAYCSSRLRPQLCDTRGRPLLTGFRLALNRSADKTWTDSSVQPQHARRL